MVREREMGFPTEFYTQDPGVEIVNDGSLGRERPFRRTPLMRQIEEQHKGIPIKRILRDLYWIQNKSYRQIGDMLGGSVDTMSRWFKRLEINTDFVRDEILAWKEGRQHGDMLVREEHNRSVVQKAVESGDFRRLTQRQQHILKIRGYLGEKPLVPLRKLKKLEDLGITFQSVSATEARALKRLKRGFAVRSKMRPEEREFILNNPRLPAKTIADILGHKGQTIGEWKDQVGVPRNPVGRPRKSEPSS